MQSEQSSAMTPAAERVGVDESRAAAEMRMSPRQCSAALVIVAAVSYFLPQAWERFEPLPVDAAYRIPYRLGNDYWQYDRVCRAAAGGEQTLLVGDSVIWGHYVSPRETLSHDLNEAVGREQFVNLGVDGIHPVAMAGLVEHYGTAIRGRRVLVNCNLLWMSSPRHDLSTDKEATFNHPNLVPQFVPWIPCYRASLSHRVGNVVGRSVPIFGWAEHLRITYFDSADLAAWTLENPDRNPLSVFAAPLPTPDEPPSPPPDTRPWTAKGMAPFSPDWVPLAESLQWRFFQRTLRILAERGNAVFVLVGPFNEYLLTEAGLRGYAERQREVAHWLSAQGIPHYVPEPLDSQLYADASHPTAEGYAALARRLAEHKVFREFCGLRLLEHASGTASEAAAARRT